MWEVLVLGNHERTNPDHDKKHQIKCFQEQSYSYPVFHTIEHQQSTNQ